MSNETKKPPKYFFGHGDAWRRWVEYKRSEREAAAVTQEPQTRPAEAPDEV